VLWAVAVTVGLGLRRFDVIDALLLFGPLVVVPLGLPLLDLGDRPATGGESLILPTAAALAVAFLLPVSGWTAVVALPWFVTTVVLAVTATERWWQALGPLRPTQHHLATIATLWLPVAAAHLVLSRAGVSYAGIRPDLIELAGVHFTFAGFGATTLAACLVASATDRRRTLAVAAGATLVIGDCVVALGHISWRPVELVGTTIVASAVLLMGALGWRAFPTSTLGRVFARLSGLAVVAPMAFALAYSWALTTDSAHLSYDTIAAVHGSLNAFGFVTCGLLAWRLGERPVESPCLRELAIDVWGLALLFGMACGPVSVSLLSLLFFFVAAPVGAMVGLALGLPLAAGLTLALAFRPDPRRWPRDFERGLKVVGLTVAVGVVFPLNLATLGPALVHGYGNQPLLAAGSTISSTAAVAAIGWLAGRTAARRHLRRLGPLPAQPGSLCT
jgi:hypothetical protein